MTNVGNQSELDGIAIIGLAGRFPGANNAREFWKNLKNGVESISQFSIEELEIRDRFQQANQPNYVRARAILKDIDQFDADLFGIYPREAELIDPQHRVFLECCWEAIEDAGYDVTHIAESLGVFAGCSPNSYFLTHVCRDAQFVSDFASAYQVGFYTEMLGAIPDTLATRVAYKLNLRGPAVTLVCACSTSLVAVSQACTNLLTYQCDVALAGGVSITLPQKRGYLCQEGGMVSLDGHCRTFDEDAQGTVFGSGSGVVLLKRLEDAVADGDHIYGVVKGSAVNNDGAVKIGFTAPSVDGQASVIAQAQAQAGIDPSTITYIEAHGTGTPLGDPIEVAALTQVFRASTSEVGYCALGTAKTNVGHLDVAAGVTGLIKTALSLEHRQLPPILHFRRPNPKLELEKSPFYVNTELADWKTPPGVPLRAGVSAFGVGGTNAHVVLEEAPQIDFSSVSPRTHQLLVLSARSQDSLQKASLQLADHLEQCPELTLADVAFTLAQGRKEFKYRRAIAAPDSAGAISLLRSTDTSKTAPESFITENPQVYFLFPGQGSQYINMGREIYETEEVFREAVDECADILKQYWKEDIRTVMYQDPKPDSEQNVSKLDQTQFAQPAIFITEYALAQLWLSWGIQPAGMLGHSVGEFVAGCLAGVFTLEDALGLIAVRAKLMQSVDRGEMLAVRLPEQEIIPLLSDSLCLAAVNSPSLSVVSGPPDNIQSFTDLLDSKRIAFRRLRTSHAFHSSMMDGILETFTGHVNAVRMQAPRLRYLSCTTGEWISDQEATEPIYWAHHLRHTVRFSPAVEKLRAIPNAILLEVGPGSTLQTLARQHSIPDGKQQTILSSLVNPSPGSKSEAEALLNNLGRLWTKGVSPDWKAFYSGERRHRVSLPARPFERKRYWIEAAEIDDKKDASDNGNEVKKEARLQESTIMNLVSEPVVERSSARKERLQKELTSILQQLSGMDSESLDPGTTFLELGFDSLFLTQVAGAVQKNFGFTVTFRQLLDRQDCITALAEFLDENLPPSVLAEEPPKPSSNPVPVPTVIPTVESAPKLNNAVPVTGVEQIFKDQLQAMSALINRQLEFLGAGGNGQIPATQAVTQQAAPLKPEALKAEAPKTAEEPKTKEFKAFGPYKPFQRTHSDELTEQQRAYLNRLISSYTQRTKQSKEWTQKYRRVLADPRVASGFNTQWKELVYPIVTNRSRGSRLWDIDGNEYIDLLNGFGPIALGHLPDFVKDAVTAQLEKGIEIGPQTQLAGEVAELLCELTGTERATFCNTGSEAVMAAMRLARTVTGRSKIVLFAGDYHGNFEEVLIKKIGAPGSHKSGPIAPGIPPEMVQNMVVLDYGTPESLEYIRQNASELAAVLVEPVQSRHPAFQPRDFLKAVREITTASGTALIFDEIVTGFRVHQGGSQAYYGIKADLATYGKVLGGGFPIGAIAGKTRFMDALDGGHWQYGDDSAPEVGVTFFAGTFVRHPLALAAAKAVLIHLKQQGPSLQENLAKRTTKLVEQLNDVFRRYSIPSQVESCGSVFYFSFTHKFRFGSLLYYHLREKGIHIQEGFPCFLTTAHSDEDLAKVVSAFEESARAMSEGGVLPSAVESQSPTIASAPPVVVKPTVAEVAETEDAPVTEAQLEIWLSAQLSPEANCAFNESFSLRLRGDLDEQLLRDSIAELVRRHQALRATFEADGSRIHFRPQLDLTWKTVDLTGEPATDRERQYREFLRQDASTPFDLVEGPLVRLALVQMDSQSHILVFTAHHIVCDGWSTNVLIGELAEIYSARKQGRVPELQPRLPFGVWAQSQKQESNAEVESYWLKQFKTLPPVLDLPLDRPRASVKTYSGSTFRYTIGGGVLKHIKKSAAKQGATLFNVMLAGFHSLLFRLTGQSDVVVGVPAAAQSLVQDKALVGHGVNFLALRGVLEENETFAHFLTKSKASLLDAYEHQNYTYGTLVRKLSIIRDPSRLPLIEVQFNLERIATGVQFSGLELEVEPNPKQFVNFDIFFNAVETSNSLVIDCDFNTDLFDEATIARWLGHYETLLSKVSSTPGETIASFSLLTDAQRKEIIAAQTVTQSDYPRDSRVEDLISAQARKTPRASAVECDDSRLTYEELEAKSNQLARYLMKQGVGRGSNVAICLDRSVDMVVSVLAVMKSGATYIPLDPALPKERLELILTDAGVSIALSQSHVLEVLGRLCPQALALDTEQREISLESPAPLSSYGAVEDAAYIIYTSGSTGKPKGVAVSHRAVVNFLCSMRKEPGIKADDRLLAVTTLSFDIAGLELYLPLIVGACVVIANQVTTHDGELLRKELLRARISIMQATPATWRMLLDSGWEPNRTLKMLCGGEALPRPLANELLRNNDELWNMYGPTETTIWSAVSRVERGEGPVRIGKPIANTQFYVLDTNQNIVPIGVPGELVIGGDGLAIGYYQRPELTAEKFIVNRISPELGDRLYRTGDLVKVCVDGTLEFLGRLDHQIKIRGFRVELGEIEAALGKHSNIRDVVVVDREDAGVKHLVTYYTTHDSQAIPPTELKAFLFEKLPPYMVPSFFVRLEALPRTPNGKIDRRSLPAFDLNTVREKKAYRAPRSNQEKDLAAICAEVLQVEKIGVDDNLFELGADSIQIFRIVARANKIGIGLTAQQVLRNPDIEHMAQFSSTAVSSKEKPRLSPIVAVARTAYRAADDKLTPGRSNGR